MRGQRMVSAVSRQKSNLSTGDRGKEYRVARCAIRRIHLYFFDILQQAIKAGAAKNSNLSSLIQFIFPS